MWRFSSFQILRISFKDIVLECKSLFFPQSNYLSELCGLPASVKAVRVCEHTIYTTATHLHLNPINCNFLSIILYYPQWFLGYTI